MMDLNSYVCVGDEDCLEPVCINVQEAITHMAGISEICHFHRPQNNL